MANRSRISSAWLIFFALVAIAALALSIASFFTASKNTKAIPQGKWVCSVVTCSEQYTKEEWIKDFCVLGQDNQFVCNVTFNGQQIQVPLSALNFTNFQACKTFTCTQEVFVRDANYTLPVQNK